jgi:hypothetical protein
LAFAEAQVSTTQQFRNVPAGVADSAGLPDIGGVVAMLLSPESKWINRPSASRSQAG